MSKISIRFYKDHEVRAVWDEEGSKWCPLSGYDTIDGKSRKIAYTFIERNLMADKDVGTVKALQQIHAYIFGGLYDFAGKIRTKTISKGNTIFCLAEYLQQNLKTIEQMSETTFINKRDYLSAMIESQMDSTKIRTLLKSAMTDRIDDREIFMKGIDYSYYYEQEE